MIDGEPRIIERDGQRLVVDESGNELVTRHRAVKTRDRRYHRIDIEAFETGTIQPACEIKSRYGDEIMYILRSRADLDNIWDGCSFDACYGDFVQGSFAEGPALANKLEKMSVEEFDALVAGHKARRQSDD